MKNKKKNKGRSAIINDLKCNGAQSAEGLAKKLKVTPMAVRQHLYAMAKENLLDTKEVKDGRGRPTKVWSLNQNSQKLFPDNHKELALSLRDSIVDSVGEDGLSKLLQARSAKQKQEYKTAMVSETTLQQKLETIAEIRNEEGYMTSLLFEDKNTFTLTENNCPISNAAGKCGSLCEQELGLFSELLKGQAKVSRLKHILSNDNCCSYKISATDSNN